MKYLKRILTVETLPMSEFVRNVLILASGSTLAQSIPILISPLLTRIYTPENFGAFAFYLAISSIISVISTARYELAIMLPKSNTDAANILVLSIAIAISISLLTLVILLILPIDNIIFFMLPISIFFNGALQALSYWNNRLKQFKALSITKLFNSGVMVLVQIILALSFDLGSGLIYGLIAGQVCGTILLTIYQYRSFIKYKSSINKTAILSVAIRYKKKPLLSLWGGLADNIAYQMPTLAVTHIFGLVSTGFYSFASRTINLPLSLIGSSIGQVVFQKIARLYEKEPEKVRPFIKKMLTYMLAFSIPFFIFLFFTIEDIFAFIFGEAWREAGFYVSLMCLPAIIRFAATPLSVILLLEVNIHIGVIWQIIYILSISTGILISWFSNSQFEISR